MMSRGVLPLVWAACTCLCSCATFVSSVPIRSCATLDPRAAEQQAQLLLRERRLPEAFGCATDAYSAHHSPESMRLLAEITCLQGQETTARSWRRKSGDEAWPGYCPRPLHRRAWFIGVLVGGASLITGAVLTGVLLSLRDPTAAGTLDGIATGPVQFLRAP